MSTVQDNQRVEKAYLESLANAWVQSQTQGSGKSQAIMCNTIDALKVLYDKYITKQEQISLDDPNLKFIDETIQMLACKFNITEPENDEDVKLRHQIEASLWMRLNAHQLEVFREYDKKIRARRTSAEVIEKTKKATPLEIVMSEMGVQEEEKGDEIGSDSDTSYEGSDAEVEDEGDEDNEDDDFIEDDIEEEEDDDDEAA